MIETLPLALVTASSAIVADALDSLGLRGQVVDPRVRPIYAGATVVGRAYPVKVVDDDSPTDTPYAGEMDALGAMSPGDVGVYSVVGTSRAAAWGELFSCGAIGRGAKGVLVDGYVRDSAQIEELAFPVFAVGCSPLDTLGRARVVDHGNEIEFGGVTVRLGDIVVADRDGVIIVPAGHVDSVAQFVGAKKALEKGARLDLIAGSSIKDVWTKYGVF